MGDFNGCTRPFVSFCRRKGGLKTATESTFSEDSKLLQLFNRKAQVVAMPPRERLETCWVSIHAIAVDC